MSSTLLEEINNKILELMCRFNQHISYGNEYIMKITTVSTFHDHILMMGYPVATKEKKGVVETTQGEVSRTIVVHIVLS